MTPEQKAKLAGILGYRFDYHRYFPKPYPIGTSLYVGEGFDPTADPYYWKILRGLSRDERESVEKILSAPNVGIDASIWYNDNRTTVLEAIESVKQGESDGL